MIICVVFCCFFFFKQKTAYEMRISDWSSDVCSSDLKANVENLDPDAVERELQGGDAVLVDIRDAPELDADGSIPGSVHVPRGMLEFRADTSKIGRASCRERVCQYV